jgi:succinyl-CoA synthetase beta subunit
LYRQSLSPREMRARELGVSFVPLDGDIAVITSGAGLGMCTLDLLKQQGLSAANFLDTGGGISEGLVKGALQLIMEPPQVRGAIINLYGGINRMLEAAKGIVAALQTLPANRPLVVKILGNQQEEAWAMLETVPNVHVVREVQTEAAVSKLAELVR